MTTINKNSELTDTQKMKLEFETKHIVLLKDVLDMSGLTEKDKREFGREILKNNYFRGKEMCMNCLLELFHGEIDTQFLDSDKFLNLCHNLEMLNEYFKGDGFICI